MLRRAPWRPLALPVVLLALPVIPAAAQSAGAGEEAAQMAARPTVHMVGNAHIDAAWLWRMSETHDEVMRTFRSALDRMNEYPEFRFTQSQAVFFDWVEGYDPTMLGEIRRRVEEGRWNLVGGWWVEPDCNVPNGESFVRQALLGQQYYQSRFGRTATVGCLPDSFGHIGTLPQILAKSGCDCFVFSRPGREEKPGSPDLFWWEAPDGSRVLGIRLVQHYCTSGEAEGMPERILQAPREYPAALGEAVCFYGVGNHGGGPTKANIEAILATRQRPDAPGIIFSTPDAFAAAVMASPRAADLPVVRDDLQHHARGCYSALAWIKDTNCELELLLREAETFATCAAALGGSYPAVPLHQAWQAVLFNQFHDVLAGTSIPSVYEDSAVMYEGARAAGAAAREQGLAVVAGQVDTSGAPRSVVVLNPCLGERIGPVEVELPRGAGLATADGNAVPVQRLGEGRTLFAARVPGLGYRAYHVVRGGAPPVPAELKARSPVLENDWWRLEVSRETGGIARLTDKEQGCEVFRSGGGAIPIVIEDPTDTWGHSIVSMREEAARPTSAEVEAVERGPVRAVIRSTAKVAGSIVTQEFTLYADSPAIDVRCTVDWQERRRALKLAFPVNLRDTVSTYGIPFGSIVREQTGNEEPGQMWLDLSAGSEGDGRPYGLSLLTVAKYGFDVLDGEARVTILRSPPYAFHDPRPFDPNEQYDWQDQGLHEFRYGLLPRVGSWQEARTPQRAWELHLPLVAVLEAAHAGSLGAEGSFVEVNAASVALSAVKRAEGSDDVVVRLYETEGRAAKLKVTLRLGRRKATWSGAIGAAEIKTLRFPADGGAACEVDLLEREG